MIRRIVSDTFEQLGQVAGSAIKQAVKTPAGILDEAAKQVLPVGRQVELAPEGIEQPVSSQTGGGKTAGKLTPEEINKKVAAAERKRSILHYQELQREIEELAVRRRAIREQAEIKKRQELQALAEEKKKQGPFEWARKKAREAVEKFRGASG